MRGADRNLNGIFLTPTDRSALLAAGLIGSLGSSFSPPTIKSVLVGMDGSSSGATLGSLGLGLGRSTTR